MTSLQDYQDQEWFQFLDPGMKDLVKQSYHLLDAFSLSRPSSRGSSILSGQPSAFDLGKIADFSFIVFPMAKAYEGFLKKWLFQSGLIEESAYRSDHFRIGKSLNPSLPERFKRDDYVYDKIVAQCSDLNLGDRLWRAWKQCRNLVFHYFPQHEHFLTLDQAKKRINQLAAAMEDAVGCSVEV